MKVRALKLPEEIRWPISTLKGAQSLVFRKIQIKSQSVINR